MNAFLRQLRPAVVAVLVFTVICGLAYPLVVTGLAQVGLGDKADGSLIERDGVVVGSELIGQPFSSAAVLPSPPVRGRRRLRRRRVERLEPRPDQPRVPGDGRASGSRPTASENGLGDDALVPVDAVTASGSGLDPHISVRNARLQAARVAAEPAA